MTTLKVHNSVHRTVKLLTALINAVGAVEADLQRKAGVSVNTFYTWRAGRNSPSVDTLEAALNTLGWSIIAVPTEELGKYVPDKTAPVIDSLRHARQYLGAKGSIPEPAASVVRQTLDEILKEENQCHT